MSDTDEPTTDATDRSGAAPSADELEDAAVSAMRECEEDSDTTIDGAPRGAVVDALQEEYDIGEEAALQAILDTQMAGRAYMTRGSEQADQPHIRAPDEPDPNEDPRDDIATSNSAGSGSYSSDDHPSPEDLGIPLSEVTPDPPEDESQPVEEEPDRILDDEDPGREPEFPGMMSGESIRLRGDEDEEWREPRSLY
jgi:hypothetical protein